ncbi:MAG TPA: peptidoglycan-binding domain-containing protein [Bryobacteraceae bacterium]|nr:peptidoglycan-binding domain-containing protein [Bryobacteraceae bacterium]HPQ15899.1 peptidoglycan-binding domain-containing protein [Bryobacteraceae bacterium]HPU72485.1 peptidoglycan-binding domain-containing protein [Bryobacteraceae bacterium]
MRVYGALCLVLLLALPAPCAAQEKTAASKPATAASKKATTPAAKKTTAKKTTAAKKTAKKQTARKRAPAAKQSWRTGQMAPTPERYREIQQALIDKGYYQGSANGVWDSECTEALKKFQQDQNLKPDGKLDSLTLISLGLGPRRENANSANSVPAVKPPSGEEPQQPR